MVVGKTPNFGTIFLKTPLMDPGQKLWGDCVNFKEKKNGTSVLTLKLSKGRAFTIAEPKGDKIN